MTAQLDPYSEFIPPEKKGAFEEEMDGEFGGLGVLIFVDKGQVVITTALEDTPAWLAGIGWSWQPLGVWGARSHWR